MSCHFGTGKRTPQPQPPSGEDAAARRGEHIKGAGPDMTWTATQSAPGADVHVLPDNDLIPHTERDDCACGPTPEAVKRNDGSIGWLNTHHSLDGRETNE